MKRPELCDVCPDCGAAVIVLTDRHSGELQTVDHEPLLLWVVVTADLKAARQWGYQAHVLSCAKKGSTRG